jgi:hypothetical protein
MFTLVEHNLKHYPNEEMHYRIAIEYFEADDTISCISHLAQANSLNLDLKFNNGFYFYLKLAYIFQETRQMHYAREIIQSALLKDLNIDHSQLKISNVEKLFPLSADEKENAKSTF